ncbi:MAG: iron-sulfur cluster assembly protein, partial [Tannerellaceae bacterium]
MALYPNLILEALAKVRYPGTGQDLVSSGMVEDDMRIDGNKVTFSLIFEKPNDPFIKSVVKAAETAILKYAGEDIEIKGNINVKAKQAPRPEPDKLLPQVKNI